MKPIIEFKNFTFKYNAQAVPTLKDINLKIYPNEKILIIGSSGSGKTTLGNCINGLIPQTYKGEWSGEVWIDDKQFGENNIYNLSLSVGTVLQDTDDQFVGLSVAEDIAFSLENDMIEVSEMKKIVKNWAEKIQLRDFLNYKPQELSGGMKQKVSIAGVLIDKTPILLFDEPLANLDPIASEKSIELIDDIHNEFNNTIIIIEHRLEEVLYKPIDRIILVAEGIIVFDGIPNELLKTNLLIKSGIREPLYISALKKADINLDDFKHLDNINEIKSAEIEKKLNDWESKIKIKPIEHSKKLLEVKNLVFKYAPSKPNAIDDVSFDLYEGEMVSLVGHNGSGKSTLSSLITGFYKPDSGDILIDGKSILNESIKERADKIGYVLQNANQMISKIMIYDEVALGLRNRNIPEEKIKEKVYEKLKICGLYEFRNWPVSALSYGQKRRVAIASILVLNPKIIILDEPTAGQDYSHYNEMMQFLKSLNKNGITILIITHDMHLILEYTTRTFIMNKGKLVANLPPFKVLTNEELTKESSLKETSLYTLAKINNLTDPTKFVETFIEVE